MRQFLHIHSSAFLSDGALDHQVEFILIAPLPLDFMVCPMPARQFQAEAMGAKEGPVAGSRRELVAAAPAFRNARRFMPKSKQ